MVYLYLVNGKGTARQHLKAWYLKLRHCKAKKLFVGKYECNRYKLSANRNNIIDKI